MQSKAATVEQYLAELPPERRESIQSVREVILRNLGAGYKEGMAYGMIGYVVPHSIYPPGYHCDPKLPLTFASLASQKNYMAVYIMSLYGPGSDEAWFRDAWAATGKKLDMGKCCVRFRTLDDAALGVIGEAIRRMPVERWIEFYEKGLRQADRDRQARRDAKAAGGAASKAGGATSSKKSPGTPAKQAPSKARKAGVAASARKPAKPSPTTKKASSASTRGPAKQAAKAPKRRASTRAKAGVTRR
ncbi:MAG: DUF1801 domain-containing protein [Phycisphaerales bacterium]